MRASAHSAFTRKAARSSPRLETIGLDDLAAGDVVIKVRYSTINYKDALAATGAGKILRKYPLVGGIDLAGEVVSSQHAAFKPGQKVLVNGCGLSETHDGGYAEYARVQGDWVVPIPAGPRRVPVHGDRHRRLHRGARDPSHGAERPASPRAARSS